VPGSVNAPHGCGTLTVLPPHALPVYTRHVAVVRATVHRAFTPPQICYTACRRYFRLLPHLPRRLLRLAVLHVRYALVTVHRATTFTCLRLDMAELPPRIFAAFGLLHSTWQHFAGFPRTFPVRLQVYLPHTRGYGSAPAGLPGYLPAVPAPYTGWVQFFGSVTHTHTPY